MLTQPIFSTALFLPFLHASQTGPQYQRLFRAFQQAILHGSLPPGTRLPATRPLCSALNLSRNTVKTAYEMLIAEGYLETRHGAGTFVSSQLPEPGLTRPTSDIISSTTTTAPQLSKTAQRLLQQTNSNPPSSGRLLQPARPCVQSFPWQQWQRHVTAAARQMKHAPLINRLGCDELRQQIASYLQVVRGVHCSAEQILISAGSQQAMYLALTLLLNEGEPVLTEDPGYQGVDGAITAVGARKIAVPIDDQGFRLDDGLALAPEARVAMLTPSRNHPLGHTLSLERRLALLNWAQQQGGWLIEDDYDSDFRFDGPPLTSLQGLGGEDCVIYTGTFSRILHPSIRLGYLVLPAQLVEPFSNARRYMDGGLPLLPQMALAGFMACGQFSSHVRRMRKLYQQRRDQLHVQIQARFGSQLQRLDADGGMHSVYLLPAGYSDSQICDLAQQQNLGIRALSRYYASGNGLQGLVIGFSSDSHEQMQQGLDRLWLIFSNLSPDSSGQNQNTAQV